MFIRDLSQYSLAICKPPDLVRWVFVRITTTSHDEKLTNGHPMSR